MKVSALCVALLLLTANLATPAVADSIVAAPIRQVLQILRKDPAALQEAKYAVLHGAAQEGRILQDSDLTDDKLFRMISDDPSVAILVTKVISARQQASAARAGSEADTDIPTGTSESTILQNAGLSAQSQTPNIAQAQYAQRPQYAGQTEYGAETQNAQQTQSANLPSLSVPSPSMMQMQLGPSADQSTEQSVQGSNRVLASENSALRGDSTKQSKASTVFTPVQHPYASVRALDDLYKQVATPTSVPERFGATVFQNGTGNLDTLPMDMPVGPDYVIGPGDGLKIELWGGVSERLQRVVDREGRIGLPETGPLQVSGLSLAEAQRTIQSSLRSQFRDIQAEVSLTRLRSVRVYVVGDVERPGAYDISSLSTPLNALYAAGGPTERGSLRTLRHYRGKQLVQEVDVYELLLHGVHSGIQRLESGDTVLVPPLVREVTIEGMVRRPAIYELHDEADLASVLELAGGVLPTGTKRHIDIERIEAHDKRVMLSLDLAEGASRDEVAAKLKGFLIQDGDSIHVSPILSYAEKAVYLDGHVFNPGRRSWHEGMNVRDLIRSYSDLLPEPHRAHAEIVRLVPPDFRPEVIGFNLGETMEANATGPTLQPFDTVRVFGRFDFEDPPDIDVTGEVRTPGLHHTNGETRLCDAIYLAGGVTPDALLDYVHVFRHVEGSKVQVLSADLRKAMAGVSRENIILFPRDQVVVHRNVAKVDPTVVYISGRVMAPGKYPLSDRMTASDLVRMAGGFRRGAYTLTADLARVAIEKDEAGIASETRQVKIAEALAGNTAEDVVLRDGDVLSIRQIAGWDDIGASITIRGEVMHAGTYGITAGERLSSVLERAGGFYRGAYPAGAMLSRVEVKELAERSKADLIERLEETAAADPQFSPGTTTQEQLALAKAAQAQQQQMIATLKRQEVDGRLVVRITEDTSKWRNTASDIEVRDGDVLIIPKRPTFVLVSGQVYNRSAITWVPGKRASWYLHNAGGPTESANKKAIYIIRADGSIIGQGSNVGWNRDVLRAKLQPGDTIIVPEKILATSNKWRSLLGAAQMMSSFAVSAAVFSGI